MANENNCQVYWETTISNAYRKSNFVRETLKQYNFSLHEISGCCFGQTLMRPNDPPDAPLARKTWAIYAMSDECFQET